MCRCEPEVAGKSDLGEGSGIKRCLKRKDAEVLHGGAECTRMCAKENPETDGGAEVAEDGLPWEKWRGPIRTLRDRLQVG